jgi:hypothetical protein
MVTYSRALPGGGLVFIEDAPDGARLWVERRTDPHRRVGHTPPILARATDANELIEIASDNVAVARAIQRWQAGSGGSSERTDTNS